VIREAFNFIVKWSIIGVVVGFLAFQLFTNPVGSAHFVSSIFSHIWGAFNSIGIFISNL